MAADDKKPTEDDLDLLLVKKLLDDFACRLEEEDIAELDDRDTLASIEKF